MVAEPMPPGFAFRDRAPTSAEFERLRLTLSTYRDGSGQLATSVGSMPGWRDFERAMAAVLGGRAVESKAVFDVEVPTDGLPFGLSCKTSTLHRGAATVLMELSNSAAKFMAHIAELGLDPRDQYADACQAVIALIASWHTAEAQRVDIGASSYVVLAHDPGYVGWRLLWFGLALTDPDPGSLDWEQSGKRIAGFDRAGNMIWEWYPWSGGQLKYRPLIESARWDSDWFHLEEPPFQSPAAKAAEYWPRLWPRNR